MWRKVRAAVRRLFRPDPLLDMSAFEGFKRTGDNYFYGDGIWFVSVTVYNPKKYNVIIHNSSSTTNGYFHGTKHEQFMSVLGALGFPPVLKAAKRAERIRKIENL